MIRNLAFLVTSLAVVACAPAATGSADAVDFTRPSGHGPFTVASYTDIPDRPEFADATIYYPLEINREIAGVAIAPGFTEEQEDIDWWGPWLASHGFAVLILDTNDPRERPEARSTALAAAVETLRSEDTRPGSPIQHRIDPTRMAVMGHSMGGGGALLAADSLGDAIQAVIPFTPWQPDADFSGITAPTLIIAGSADQIAGVEEHALPHFRSIPSTTRKLYLELDGGDHFIANTDRGTDLATIGKYALAWLRVHLDGVEEDWDVLRDPRVDGAKFSRYLWN